MLTRGMRLAGSPSLHLLCAACAVSCARPAPTRALCPERAVPPAPSQAQEAMELDLQSTQPTQPLQPFDGNVAAEAPTSAGDESALEAQCERWDVTYIGCATRL